MKMGTGEGRYWKDVRAIDTGGNALSFYLNMHTTLCIGDKHELKRS